MVCFDLSRVQHTGNSFVPYESTGWKVETLQTRFLEATMTWVQLFWKYNCLDSGHMTKKIKFEDTKI